MLRVQAVSPTSDRMKRGKTVQTAILSQDVGELHNVDHPRVTEVIEQEIRVVSVGRKREVSTSQLVEQLGFTNQRQRTPVGDLSGGERGVCSCCACRGGAERANAR